MSHKLTTDTIMIMENSFLVQFHKYFTFLSLVFRIRTEFWLEFSKF